LKLLTASQIRAWDKFTIKNEPILSIDLMERASLCFVDWYVGMYKNTGISVHIFCGNGNNGGDGLAIARLLRDRLYEVAVYITRFAAEDSLDFDINLTRLQKYGDVKIQYQSDTLPEIEAKGIIIDALLGSGVNKPVSGKLRDIICHINDLPNEKISVDMPSGLPSEGIAIGTTFIPDIIFTLQVPKQSFFLQENELYCRSWVVGDIRLHPDFLRETISEVDLIDHDLARKMYKKRSKFQHKGHFGHAMIIAGSEGKIGAAILAAKACLRTGAGLVTACVPDIGCDIIHIIVPEVMVMPTGRNVLANLQVDFSQYTIGIGPGLGLSENTIDAFTLILKDIQQPMVLDADAINIISLHPELLSLLPVGTILTPHPKEFSRLFGHVISETDRLELAKEMAIRHKIILVLKGAYTRVFTPSGHEFINHTGNPGMATGGSGDVLTGIVTGLLAQKYSPVDSAVLGVFLHGLAGDFALENESVESLIASDIIINLGKAFKTLH
jgi:ADP-dependent NAD(P)H-hydrate dehydratase / NAD(P)H-hydrate epimerase